MTPEFQFSEAGGPSAVATGERFANQSGAPVVNAGARLDPAAIGILAALNMSGHPDLVTSVATEFLKAMPGYLVALRENVVSPDLRTLSRISHDLKSSAASLGAVALASMCADLEKLARAGTAYGTAAKLCRIVAEIEAVCPELEALLLSRRNGGQSDSTAVTANQYEDAT